MSAIATFNYSTWVARYPEFNGTVNEATAGLYFGEAGLYLNNVGGGQVCDPATQQALMYMMTAHIAALNMQQCGNDSASGIVGRISSASEGSVSVSVENDYPAGSPQWYQQTKYGSAFWAATARFRTARYFPSLVGRPTYPPFTGGRGF